VTITEVWVIVVVGIVAVLAYWFLGRK